MEDYYSVWVGGVEINDNYLDCDQANQLLNEYLELGYDDVQLEKIN